MVANKLEKIIDTANEVPLQHGNLKLTKKIVIKKNKELQLILCTFLTFQCPKER